MDLGDPRRPRKTRTHLERRGLPAVRLLSPSRVTFSPSFPASPLSPLWPVCPWKHNQTPDTVGFCCRPPSPAAVVYVP